MINDKKHKSSILNWIKDRATKITITAVFFGLASTTIPATEYADIPGFGKDYEAGRTKNSIAAVVAGVVGHQMYGDSNIDLKIKKHFWPDTEVKGYTTKNNIDTRIDTLLSSTNFTAKRKNGLLEGEVDKSEFNWQVRQIDQHTYEIARWGPKFDAELEIRVADGEIKGTYIRPGPHFDWDIEGTYDNNGNVELEIDGPLCLGIVLSGKIYGKK